ncbi:hypothetical protein ACTOVN_00185 [Arcanobacterium canis]
MNAHYTNGAYVEAMWSALERAGVSGGRGLEPGCGAGTFISHAPAGMSMTGVEIDSTTAKISAALNPDDEILSEGFEKTRVQPVFDVVVGNVPFGDVRLYDPMHNPGNHSIMRLENMVASLGTRRDTQNSRREYIESEMKELQSEMDKPSPYREELADKREELTVVTREITRARKSGNAPEHQAHLSL